MMRRILTISKDSNDAKDSTDSKDSNDAKDSKDSKDSNDAKDSKDFKGFEVQGLQRFEGTPKKEFEGFQGLQRFEGGEPPRYILFFFSYFSVHFV